MRVVIAGSSGLIGTALRESLESDGHTAVRLSRPVSASWTAAVDDADVVINLAGAGIGERRWNSAYRSIILTSRTETTEALAVRAAQAARPPRVLISASGIRYYGSDRGEEVLTETTPSTGTGFLTEVVRAWEEATRPASRAGIPVCHLRLGIVMSRYGGAFARLLPFFRAGLGAQFGSGRQFWSYVSLADTVRAIRFLADSPDARGPYNITAPSPARNSEFTRRLGRLLGRPALLHVPNLALQLALGGVAEDAITSLRVVPQRLIEAGFRHDHPDIESALRAALG